MGKKQTKKSETPTEATSETTTSEVATATVAAPEPAPEPTPVAEPKKKGKAKKAKIPGGDATLADVAAGYLAHMENAGKSEGTISSYRMELKTAAAEIGEDTKIADLTAERVQEYFDCKRVTKLRSGRNKAKPSVDKTRRVLRLALVWAEERGILAMAPIPEVAEAKA